MNKIKCNHCGSISFDDARGNCCACGAPRSLTPAFDKAFNSSEPIFSNVALGYQAMTIPYSEYHKDFKFDNISSNKFWENGKVGGDIAPGTGVNNVKVGE